MKYLFFTTVFFLITNQAFGGNKEDGEAWLKENAKKEGVVVLPSGLQYKVLKAAPAGRPHPKIDTTCSCHYRGTLIDGREFDSSYSRGQPTSFAPNQVIKGWTEAMQLMSRGDKWELYIPSELAYGDRQQGELIMPGSTLIFTLEILQVGDGPTDNVDSKTDSSDSKSEKEEVEKEVKKSVVHLTEENFDETIFNSDHHWIVEFYAPWCGHCKKLEPEYEKAAKALENYEYKGMKIKLAAVDATVHRGVANRFGTNGFPTLKVVRAGSTSAKEAEDYQGGRDETSIVRAAKELCKPVIPTLEVLQLTDQSQFKSCLKERKRHEEEGKESHTLSTGSWCVVAFLPHILDTTADERRKVLSELKSAYNNHRLGELQVYWTESGQQPELEEALRKTGLDLTFPTIAAFNQETGKQRLATYVGKFSGRQVDDFFLPSLRNGWAKTRSLDKMPTAQKCTEWDGENGSVDVEEEEFSLEDIMGEDL
eukprot:g4189.t1